MNVWCPCNCLLHPQLFTCNIYWSGDSFQDEPFLEDIMMDEEPDYRPTAFASCWNRDRQQSSHSMCGVRTRYIHNNSTMLHPNYSGHMGKACEKMKLIVGDCTIQICPGSTTYHLNISKTKRRWDNCTYIHVPSITIQVSCLE